jgi:hypothetical protein
MMEKEVKRETIRTMRTIMENTLGKRGFLSSFQILKCTILLLFADFSIPDVKVFILLVDDLPRRFGGYHVLIMLVTQNVCPGMPSAPEFTGLAYPGGNITVALHLTMRGRRNN